MMDEKALADLICRALLAIVAAIRQRYDLPEYKNIRIIVEASKNDHSLENSS